MPMPFVPDWDPRKRRREERNKKHPKVIQSSIPQHPNQCSNNHHSCSSYLGVHLCLKHHGSRASPDDWTSMGASAAGICYSHRWTSMVFINSISFADIKYISFSKIVLLTKYICTCTVWALCSASAYSGEYVWKPGVIGKWHWLVDAVWGSIHLWKSPSVTIQSTSLLHTR